MELKVAEYNDFDAIAQLHTRSWQKYYQGILKQDYLDDEILNERRAIWQTRLTNPPFNQHILMMLDKGNLCGFICVFGHHDFEKGSMVDALHVDPQYQHRGVATALLKGVSEWLEQFFADSGIYLEVLVKNRQAVAFYQHIRGNCVENRKWVAPCGTEVDEAIYCWESPKQLLLELETHHAHSLNTL